jgi:glycosyltransferase involved in cell wall biosynthesis
MKHCNILVLGRVTHYRYQGQLYAYTPYAREIDIWAQLFQKVIIASTLREEAPPGDCAAFNQKNIEIVPIIESGGEGLLPKLLQAALLPLIFWRIARIMRRVDAVHVRCPSDLGFVGVISAPLFSKRLIAKYATQWLPRPNEPWTWRLQRCLLSSRWWRGPVTVYGSWPNQPPHIVPFFTSILTRHQIELARTAVCHRKICDHLRLLFVGRLTTGKNIHVLLKAMAQLSKSNPAISCTIVGEGPERGNLEKLAQKLGIAAQVTFLGGLAFELVLSQYAQADVLVLASNVEGWPKAVAEAMAFGLVCIGSERGVIPQMLEAGRGITVRPGDARDLALALHRLIQNPEERARMAAKAAEWGQQYSLDGLRQALRQLLGERWRTCESLKPSNADALLEP